MVCSIRGSCGLRWRACNWYRSAPRSASRAARSKSAGILRVRPSDRQQLLGEGGGLRGHAGAGEADLLQDLAAPGMGQELLRDAEVAKRHLHPGVAQRL